MKTRLSYVSLFIFCLGFAMPHTTWAQKNVRALQLPPFQEKNNLSVIETQTFIVNGVMFTMVQIEGGTFIMGATSEQGSNVDREEMPTHQVTLSSFSIGQTEVTQELWQAVMGNNPSEFRSAKHPVEKVSWDDCQEFIMKLNALTGKGFRLPTEAEWEFAARGGNRSQGYKFSGSNNIDDVAWYDGNSSGRTHDVATKLPNELGLYDMSGNVFEWCQDSYDSYRVEPQVNPIVANVLPFRIRRGGCYGCIAELGRCRVSYRERFPPSINYFNDMGFRLAL